MSADIKDFSKIQDEDVLRQMWSQADDFSVKKQIRAHMYKIREQRLKDFYTTGEVFQDIQRVDKEPLKDSQCYIKNTTKKGRSSNVTHTDALADHSFLSLKSKEMRDSESPTKDLSYDKSLDQTLATKKDTDWTVVKKNELSEDGKTRTVTKIETAFGVEERDGGINQFAAKQEKQTFNREDGDDKKKVVSRGKIISTEAEENWKSGDDKNFRSESKKVTSKQSAVTTKLENVGDEVIAKVLQDDNDNKMRPQKSLLTTDTKTTQQKQFYQKTEQQLQENTLHRQDTSTNTTTSYPNENYKQTQEFQQNIQKQQMNKKLERKSNETDRPDGSNEILLSRTVKLYKSDDPNLPDFAKSNVLDGTTKIIVETKQLADGTTVTKTKFETEGKKTFDNTEARYLSNKSDVKGTLSKNTTSLTNTKYENVDNKEIQNVEETYVLNKREAKDFKNMTSSNVIKSSSTDTSLSTQNLAKSMRDINESEIKTSIKENCDLQDSTNKQGRRELQQDHNTQNIQSTYAQKDIENIRSESRSNSFTKTVKEKKDRKVKEQNEKNIYENVYLSQSSKKNVNDLMEKTSANQQKPEETSAIIKNSIETYERSQVHDDHYKTTYQDDYTGKTYNTNNKISVEVSPSHDAFVRSLRTTPDRSTLHKSSTKCRSPRNSPSGSPSPKSTPRASPEKSNLSRKTYDKYSSDSTISRFLRESDRSPSPECKPKKTWDGNSPDLETKRITTRFDSNYRSDSSSTITKGQETKISRTKTSFEKNLEPTNKSRDIKVPSRELSPYTSRSGCETPERINITKKKENKCRDETVGTSTKTVEQVKNLGADVTDDVTVTDDIYSKKNVSDMLKRKPSAGILKNKLNYPEAASSSVTPVQPTPVKPGQASAITDFKTPPETSSIPSQTSSPTTTASEFVYQSAHQVTDLDEISTSAVENFESKVSRFLTNEALNIEDEEFPEDALPKETSQNILQQVKYGDQKQEGKERCKKRSHGKLQRKNTYEEKCKELLGLIDVDVQVKVDDENGEKETTGAIEHCTEYPSQREHIQKVAKKEKTDLKLTTEQGLEVKEAPKITVENKTTTSIGTNHEVDDYDQRKGSEKRETLKEYPSQREYASKVVKNVQKDKEDVEVARKNRLVKIEAKKIVAENQLTADIRSNQKNMDKQKEKDDKETAGAIEHCTEYPSQREHIHKVIKKDKAELKLTTEQGLEVTEAPKITVENKTTTSIGTSHEVDDYDQRKGSEERETPKEYPSQREYASKVVKNVQKDKEDLEVARKNRLVKIEAKKIVAENQLTSDVRSNQKKMNKQKEKDDKETAGAIEHCTEYPSQREHIHKVIKKDKAELKLTTEQGLEVTEAPKITVENKTTTSIGTSHEVDDYDQRKGSEERETPKEYPSQREYASKVVKNVQKDKEDLEVARKNRLVKIEAKKIVAENQLTADVRSNQKKMNKQKEKDDKETVSEYPSQRPYNYGNSDHDERPKQESRAKTLQSKESISEFPSQKRFERPEHKIVKKDKPKFEKQTKETINKTDLREVIEPLIIAKKAYKLCDDDEDKLKCFKGKTQNGNAIKTISDFNEEIEIVCSSPSKIARAKPINKIASKTTIGKTLDKKSPTEAKLVQKSPVSPTNSPIDRTSSVKKRVVERTSSKTDVKVSRITTSDRTTSLKDIVNKKEKLNKTSSQNSFLRNDSSKTMTSPTKIPLMKKPNPDVIDKKNSPIQRGVSLSKTTKLNDSDKSTTVLSKQHTEENFIHRKTLVKDQPLFTSQKFIKVIENDTKKAVKQSTSPSTNNTISQTTKNPKKKRSPATAESSSSDEGESESDNKTTDNEELKDLNKRTETINHNPDKDVEIVSELLRDKYSRQIKTHEEKLQKDKIDEQNKNNEKKNTEKQTQFSKSQTSEPELNEKERTNSLDRKRPNIHVQTKTTIYIDDCSDFPLNQPLVEFEQSKSSREASPGDIIWPRPVSPNMKEDRPRHPDQIVEPEEQSPKQRNKNTFKRPLYESVITEGEIASEKSTVITEIENVSDDDDCLLSVNDKVEKFKKEADELKNGKKSENPTPKVRRPELVADERLTNDECLLSVSEKVEKFLKTTNDLTSENVRNIKESLEEGIEHKEKTVQQEIIDIEIRERTQLDETKQIDETKPRKSSLKTEPKYAPPNQIYLTNHKTTEATNLQNIDNQKQSTKNKITNENVRKTKAIFEKNDSKIESIPSTTAINREIARMKDIAKRPSKWDKSKENTTRLTDIGIEKHDLHTSFIESERKNTGKIVVEGEKENYKSNTPNSPIEMYKKLIRDESTVGKEKNKALEKTIKASENDLFGPKIFHKEDLDVDQLLKTPPSTKIIATSSNPKRTQGTIEKSTKSEQRASKSSSRESSPVKKTPTIQENVTVTKFGVALRRTDSGKSIVKTPERRRSSVGTDSITQTIEEVFDLELLEQMLEKVNGYEQRRRIRAQIRLVKKIIDDRKKEVEIPSGKYGKWNMKKTTNETKTYNEKTHVKERSASPKMHDYQQPTESWTQRISNEIVRDITNSRSSSPKKERTPSPSKTNQDLQRKSKFINNLNDKPTDVKPVWMTQNILRKVDLSKKNTSNTTIKSTNVKTLNELKSKKRTTTTNGYVGQTVVDQPINCITSSYGLGPTDENGRPLFGIRALKHQASFNEQSQVRGTVITSSYYSETGKEPSGQMTVTNYSNDPRELGLDENDTNDSKISSITTVRKFGSNSQSKSMDNQANLPNKLSTDKLKNDSFSRHLTSESRTSSFESTSRKSTTSTQRSTQQLAQQSTRATQAFQSGSSQMEQRGVCVTTKTDTVTKATPLLNRRGSVKELTEKLIKSTTKNENKAENYPKAGLILRTTTTSTSQFEDDFSCTRSSSPDTMFSKTVSLESMDSVSEPKSGRRPGQLKTFLNTHTKVTDIQDVITRMKNSSTYEMDEDTAENIEARSLLNKFLGAQVLMSGMEPLMGRSQRSTASERTSIISKTRKAQEIVDSATISQFTRPVTHSDLKNICDCDVLDLLLNTSKSYEERRIIRSRTREVMAEKEACANILQAIESDNVENDTLAALPSDDRQSSTHEKVESSTSEQSIKNGAKSLRQNFAKFRSASEEVTSKQMSPFAKFRQLDKQNSVSSSTPPSTPIGGKRCSEPLFTFTDPALSRSASTVKDRLLFWCQNKTKSYKNVQIENFSTSWSNGMAFCALIHHFRPHAFDYEQLVPEKRRANFTLAFKVADELAGIAPLLDVDDMVSMRKPDWKCVFTYVQTIYQRFKNEEI